jgi:hypothetical protein
VSLVWFIGTLILHCPLFPVSYRFDEVIGCEEATTGWFWRTEVTRVWLIERGSSNLLLKKCKVVTGDQRICFQHDLTEKIDKGAVAYSKTSRI